MVFASCVRGFFGRGGVLFVKKVGIHEIKSVSMGYRDPWVSGRGWEMTLMIYHPPLPSVESSDNVTPAYKRERSGSQVPIAGALFIATCVGSPVTALAGLKLGMFAAVGGAIMGFATGKM